jgi:hypothetical protein
VRRIGRFLAIAFFALTALAGINNGFNEVGDATTALQLSVQIGDIAWGIFGLMVAIGIWRRQVWTGSMSIAWALTVTYTASVASFAFSDPTFANSETKIGTIAALASTGVVSALLAWYARRATKVLEPAPTPIQ